MSATKEKLRELIAQGLVKIEVTYNVECNLCGKDISSKSDEETVNLLKLHISEECEAAKFLSRFKKGTTMGEVGRYLELVSKLQGKKKFSRTDSDELFALMKKIKKEE